MIRELYTYQMEELASHGYVVAAMTHTYDGFLTLFPDGTSIEYDGRRWPRIPSIEGEANLNQLEWHTADMLAVLDYLGRLNASLHQSPIAGHLDLSRIGAFGHSFGGVAAAHACQRDQRIKACLNQDGAMAMKPYYLDVHNWGMNQAFMFIERPPNREPLTYSDLSDLKMTRARAMELIARLNSDRDRTLRSTGMGSYRVLLRRDFTTHMDFTDLPVLSARTSSDQEDRMRVLSLVRRYTLAFFDTYVRGIKAPLLDHSTPDRVLESVEKFSPAVRPN
jgi:pimeloyl-ACP methyl ester carboxylesterase